MLSRLFGSDGKPPIFLEFRSSKFFIVFTVAAAVFTDIFLYGIIVPVLPFALTTRASIPTEKVQTWISILLAVYGGALLIASPICGWYADRSPSRKWSLLVGLVMLAGSTVLLTVGSSLGVFIAGRILQGFSAAVVWVVGLALLSDTVGSEELGVHMGYVAVAMSMAILLAPLLGGIVYDKGGYYDVFAMAFGLLGIDIVLRLALIEKKVAARWLEPKETSDPTTIMDTATKKSEEGGDAPEEQQPPNNPKIAIADTSPSPSSTPTDEQRKSSDTTTTLTNPNPNTQSSHLPPIITLLSSRRLLAALFGCLVQAALLTSFDSILPLHVRSLFSWSSIGAGLIFLPLTLPSFSSPFIGALSDKYGTRYLGTSGFILAIPPLICLRLVTHNSTSQKILLCALLVIIGFTLDMILVPLMAEIAYAVEEHEAKSLPNGYLGKNGAYAQAYGLFNMSFAAGSMAGPLLAGLINAHSGWGNTTLVLGCVSAVCVVPTLLWGGGYLFDEIKAKKKRKKGEGERDLDVVVV